MIAQQARTVSMLLREKWQLEQAHREADDVEKTRDALREVAACVQILTHATAIAAGYLGADEKDQLRGDLEGMAAKARDLHGQFASQRKQVQSLASLKRKVEEVQSVLDANWSAYAQQILAPRFELLPFARAFEVGHSGLDALEASLLASSKKAPTSATQLTNFKVSIEKLDELLSSLQHSGPAVKEFLISVLQGKATLADLSPDVLDWCNSKNLSSFFRIGLGQASFRGLTP